MTEVFSEQHEPEPDLRAWVEEHIHPRLGDDWYDRAVANVGGDEISAQDLILDVMRFINGEPIAGPRRL